MNETAIHRAVFQHLRERPAAGVFSFHVPNGGKRRPIEAAIMKGLGVTAGVPDILAIKDGHTYALELKTDTGRTSAAQITTMQAMQAAGATVAVATGLDAAIRKLEEWELLNGVSA